MSHQTSSPALHTARVIMKQFSFVLRPPDTLPSGQIDTLNTSEKHIATLIDYATNVFHVVALRPELRYWQRHLSAHVASAPQIANFIQKILSAYEFIPKNSAENQMTTTLESPKEFGKVNPTVIEISKPAQEVSRFLFFYYFVSNKKTQIQEEKINQYQVAKLAEVSLGLSRTMKLVPILKSLLSKLKEGHATEIEIRKCMRETGIILEYLPSFENREEETKLLV